MQHDETRAGEAQVSAPPEQSGGQDPDLPRNKVEAPDGPRDLEAERQRDAQERRRDERREVEEQAAREREERDGRYAGEDAEELSGWERLADDFDAGRLNINDAVSRLLRAQADDDPDGIYSDEQQDDAR